MLVSALEESQIWQEEGVIASQNLELLDRYEVRKLPLTDANAM
jgi:hypothetical protein